jgi:DNA-binding transcriptional ArsR family regulator
MDQGTTSAQPPEPGDTPPPTPGAAPSPAAGVSRPTESVVRPDPRSLRALAHPLRLRLLGMLRTDGPATASQLAVRTGQSSGATSYHLRQLAAYGFVLEEAERGNARDRWWRAAHRSTEFDLAPDADEESKAIGEEYLRVVAATYARRTDAGIAALPTMNDDLGEGWDRGFTLSDMSLRLTRDEAKALIEEIDALARRFRSDDPERRHEAPRDAERVILQFQVLPTVTRPTAADVEEW